MLKRFFLAVVSVAVLSGNARADTLSGIQEAIKAPISARSLVGRAQFDGTLRVVGSSCFDVRVGQSLRSGFIFSANGTNGAAQFAGIRYGGRINGRVFRGRGVNAQLQSNVAILFTGAGARISGARVDMLIGPRSGACAARFQGTFRAR